MKHKNQLVICDYPDTTGDILFIAGPTCTYKSQLADSLLCPKSIINCDSQQVYISLPELRATPLNLTPEYKLYRYIYDDEFYSVSTWIDHALAEIQNARVEKKLPIIVGGTAFYIYMLLTNQPAAPRINMNLSNYSNTELQIIGKSNFLDRYRLERAASVFLSTGKTLTEWNQVKKNTPDLGICKIYCTNKPKEQDLKERTENILNSCLNIALPECKNKPIGFNEISLLQQGVISYEVAFQKMLISTRQYAKRQVTFFKKILRDLGG